MPLWPFAHLAGGDLRATPYLAHCLQAGRARPDSSFKTAENTSVGGRGDNTAHADIEGYPAVSAEIRSCVDLNPPPRVYTAISHLELWRSRRSPVNWTNGWKCGRTMRWSRLWCVSKRSELSAAQRMTGHKLSTSSHCGRVPSLVLGSACFESGDHHFRVLRNVSGPPAIAIRKHTGVLSTQIPLWAKCCYGLNWATGACMQPGRYANREVSHLLDENIATIFPWCRHTFWLELTKIASWAGEARSPITDGIFLPPLGVRKVFRQVI